MRIVDGLTPGTLKLSRGHGDTSKAALHRLKWFDYYHSHGQNARLTCRHFDISPQTFYRWKKRYNTRDLKTLDNRSHRPKHVRQPTASLELIAVVLKLREQYPRWGKDKLVVLLRKQGFKVSTSMVGRIIRRLKDRGLLQEPVRNHVSARKRISKRPYAIRKPKDYTVKQPGDLVQLDTLDIRPLPGMVFKHFTARDVISRWDTLEVYSRATSTTAARFLDKLERCTPFPIRAVQVDGGSEFEAVFEEECQKRNIKLFVLPPRSPKLNGCVERAHRTHTEEFYEVTDCSFDLADLRVELSKWETIYNTARLHQALDYLTPFQFLEQLKQNQREEDMCH
jgi:putative transposase